MKILNIVENTYISVKSVLRVIYNLITHSYDKITPELCNDRLRVLCNGNSLNDIISAHDKSSHYMVVNFFCLSEFYAILRPKYYVLADPAFYTDENAINALKKLNNETSWEMTLFLVNCKRSDNLNNILTNQLIKVSYMFYYLHELLSI